MKKTERNSLAKGMSHSILILCFVFIAAGLTGCRNGTSVSVNMKNTENIHGTTLGMENLIEIGGCLWYDSVTRIVYWWNGCLQHAQNATAPSPYYAPNGLPYKYNPETNTFEEIDNRCQNECCLQEGIFDTLN